MAKVKQVNCHSVSEEITDSNTKVKLSQFNDYQALVTEIVDQKGVLGTVFYVPGVNYKTLKSGPKSHHT